MNNTMVRMVSVHKASVMKQVRASSSGWGGFIAPSNVSEFHVNDGWMLGMPIRIKCDSKGVVKAYRDRKELGLLDEVLEEFMNHNCNGELGNRVRFWEVARP